MKMHELLQIIDIKNIPKFMVNHVGVSYHSLTEHYKNAEVTGINIISSIVMFDNDSIKFSLITDDVETLVSKVDVEFELPNTPAYVELILNINVKGD